MALTDVTAQQVTAFMSGLAKDGLSGKYQRNIFDLLRCLFDLALTYDLITTSPVKPRLHRPLTEKAEKIILPLDKWREFFLAIPEGTWRATILILLTTGMRQCELLGLRWFNIDFTRRMITKTHIYCSKGRKLLPGLKTTKKTGESKHEVGMSDLMIHVLTQHRQASPFNRPEDMVFCNQIGEVLSPDSMRDVIHRALKAAGIPKLPRATGTHMLRHTAGTFIMNTTGDLKMASEQLGHADIGTTSNIYGHTDDARRLKSAEVLSSPLAQFIDITPESAQNLSKIFAN
jgi:integrase